MRVEVGIPTMNNQRTIWQTLAAFANQTLPPDRIHVIDASTDWTPYIIELFSGHSDLPFELEVEYQTNNSGVGAARTRIYEKFEGDILACFDTNAVPGQQWVEDHVRTHEENPSVDMVSGANGEQNPRVVTSPHDRRFLVQNNCFKKRALDEVNGWDEKFDRGEDWDIAIRLWRSGAKAYVRSDLTREWISSESLNSRLRTRLGRPSSVRFLRKYGVWYAKFHPAHVLGDLVSMISTLAGILAFPLMWFFGAEAGFLLVFPLLGAVGYMIMQSHIRTSGGFDVQFAIRKVPMFLLFGYTAVREIVSGPVSGWNYGGIN